MLRFDDGSFVESCIDKECAMGIAQTPPQVRQIIDFCCFL
jgi:hypothetical protein